VLAAKNEREGARRAYLLAGRMFEEMTVTMGQERVRAALAQLDRKQSLRSA
jgi:hypothetical protein